MTRLALALPLLLLACAACAAASGYDPKRYAGDAGAPAPDPDTAPLAPTAKPTIADPKRPPPAPSDAGAPDAT
ncbi:MAG: hypothetical protein KIT84_31800 [Labilithrix sp.]|nr:hypothetical protein [Labilithrix sp.]MCW5815655.1 hypothetical protein [Labilithrix sp.]